MAIFAFEFWKRVDELRGERTLADISRATGIDNHKIRQQRSDNRFPKPEDLRKIAEYLGTSEEYLLTGLVKESEARKKDTMSPEALAVEKDDRLKALVRACMRDDRLLDIISAVVESSEKTLSKKA